MHHLRVCLVALLATAGCTTIIDKLVGHGNDPAPSAEVPAPSAAAAPPTSNDTVTVTGPGGKVVQVTGGPGTERVTIMGPKGPVQITRITGDAGTVAHIEGSHGGFTAVATDGGAHVQAGANKIDVTTDKNGGASVSVGGKTITIPGVPH